MAIHSQRLKFTNTYTWDFGRDYNYINKETYFVAHTHMLTITEFEMNSKFVSKKNKTKRNVQ